MPLPHYAEVTILSSPKHPPLLDSEYARARYTHIILYLETTLEAIEAVVLKLI